MYWSNLILGKRITLCGIEGTVRKVGFDRFYFISASFGKNYLFFEAAGIHSSDVPDFCRKHIGYLGGGGFPECDNLEDLTKLCNALQREYLKKVSPSFGINDNI